jgi:flagellar protein FlgJ
MDPISFTPPQKSFSLTDLQNSKTKDPKELEKAAKGFESYFLYTLLQEMQKTMPKGSMFGSGPGSDIYQHLFQQSMSDMIAGQNGLGLAKMMVKHIDKYEKQSGAAPGEVDLHPLHPPAGGTASDPIPLSPESKPFYPIVR